VYISGTLHLYSGPDRELFFTFDDWVAQDLYASGDFDLDKKETRQVFVSVGKDRFIHKRTLSFSRKQSEIKVSLCKDTTKDNLGALTTLYDWFAPPGIVRPKVIVVVGTLAKANYLGVRVWELSIQEPVDLVSPPGFERRTKEPSKSRKTYIRRSSVQQQNLGDIGRIAEKRALAVLRRHYPQPKYSCLWRDGFLDSEKIAIRELGIICDIDVWNVSADCAFAFLEIKAQQLRSRRTRPAFYLSSAEWRSANVAKQVNLPYLIWLVQYERLDALRDLDGKVRILECRGIKQEWASPDVLYITPESTSLREIPTD